MTEERQYVIPVIVTDETVLVNNKVKQKFMAMMKGMDEEMNKISTMLQNAQCAGGVYSLQYRADTESPSIVTDYLQYMNERNNRLPEDEEDVKYHNKQAAYKYWQSLVASPLVVQDDRGKNLKLQFDLTKFKPNEVRVLVEGCVLHVHARHVDKCMKHAKIREYNRKFLLPAKIGLDCIRCNLSKDGVLTILAPLPTWAECNQWDDMANKLDEDLRKEI